ncbi:MAG: hypothetical protein ACK4UJ_08015 [Leptonema sp. (in: bacteria)]
MTKVLVHPSNLFKTFKKYIAILLFMGFLELLWGNLILYINHLTSFQKLYLNVEDLYYFINIYSMNSILHSFYIILASLFSYFLRSKQWFRSALIFNLFPFIGFLFGMIQIPIAVIILKKIQTKQWEAFFINYDDFSSMNI